MPDPAVPASIRSRTAQSLMESAKTHDMVSGESVEESSAESRQRVLQRTEMAIAGGRRRLHEGKQEEINRDEGRDEEARPYRLCGRAAPALRMSSGITGAPQAAR